MKERASTMRAMIDSLVAIDTRAKMHADIAKGFAAGLAISGLTTDHVETAIGTDSGFWSIDADSRRVWRVQP